MYSFLTAIVSPTVLGIVLVIVFIGTAILTVVVRHKYQYTPEREKDLEEVAQKSVPGYDSGQRQKDVVRQQEIAKQKDTAGQQKNAGQKDTTGQNEIEK